MTKRSSPFEPCICRQSKIHLNNYENDLNALRNMEERTLKKLMEGARKSHLIILNSEDHLVSSNGWIKNNNFMQKCLTNYFTVNGKKLNENGKTLTSTVDTRKRCFFCDSSTCSVYQCSHCLEFYCSACSFVNYESLDEKRICMSCS